jgi:hypothetical protein
MAQELEKTREQQVDTGANKLPKISLLKTREEMRVGDYLRNYLLEILALFFWIYTIMKVFVFDVDSWLANSFFPDYAWLLSFKLIYILALVSLIWLWVGTRDVIIWFFYIVFYPLVNILIKLPIYIFKQRSWLLAFATLNAIAAFFVNLKYGLVFTTIFLAAFSIAIFSHSTYLLPIAIITLLTLVLVAYVKSFLGAMKPTVVFQIYSKFFKGVRKLGHTSFALDAEIRNLPIETLEPKQLEKWNTSLQTSVLFNRFCLFTATKLGEYQRSEWRMIPSIFGLLWLVVFTVISFSGTYFSLYKINSGLFAFVKEPTLFTFFYFSFNNLVLNSTPEIAVSMKLSQSIYMVQESLSFLLVVIIATLYISHRAQKSTAELDEVIAGVEEEAKSMESFIQEEYKIESITIAMERLKEMQSGLVQLIYWLSKGIR